VRRRPDPDGVLITGAVPPIHKTPMIVSYLCPRSMEDYRRYSVFSMCNSRALQVNAARAEMKRTSGVRQHGLHDSPVSHTHPDEIRVTDGRDEEGKCERCEGGPGRVVILKSRRRPGLDSVLMSSLTFATNDIK